MKKTLSILCLLISGCAPYSVVSTDKDNSVDFRKYKTYAWLPDKDNSNNTLNNQIMRNNLKNYFTHEMVDNYGLKPNTETPDILMEFKVTAANKTETEEHPVTTNVPNYSYNYPYQSNPYPNNNPYSQNSYYTPSPNPYNYNGYSSSYRYQTNYIKEQHNFTESTITLNMIDRVRNQLVWTATAQADIYDQSSEYMKSQLHPAVHKVMKYFPLLKIENAKKK